MKIMHADLFPETLLVTVANGHTQTDSLKVAKHFHKAHKHVLRDIEELLKKCTEAGISRPNFGPSEYKNTRGKVFKMYIMDRKAFCMLVSTFTGMKALVWQDQYHTAFENMDTYIHAEADRRANALKLLKPNYIVIEEGDAQGLSRADIAQRTGHKCLGSITANRKKMRALGLRTKTVVIKTKSVDELKFQPVKTGSAA
ncbi:Rha family transcriptional regulator [Rhodoferax sp. U2-2l]|uniref:Rha family transcriptional regulator n=1 Tax=Rhodoferax sp. U2-2l TaxID=2884000 RepID=UPI001D0B34FB|nr:Rha family transcriptional regulator [Rhodoferax sp. U2-2l]MCB8748330.1 Rha family transcriptional regulator [Rhodoferax sp. U2-2l]